VLNENETEIYPRVTSAGRPGAALIYILIMYTYPYQSVREAA
jgi:hypothetical protein